MVVSFGADSVGMLLTSTMPGWSSAKTASYEVVYGRRLAAGDWPAAMGGTAAAEESAEEDGGNEGGGDEAGGGEGGGEGAAAAPTLRQHKVATRRTTRCTTYGSVRPTFHARSTLSAWASAVWSSLRSSNPHPQPHPQPNLNPEPYPNPTASRWSSCSSPRSWSRSSSGTGPC